MLTKSVLIQRMKERNKDLSDAQIEFAVEQIIHQIKEGLMTGRRIEVRGFGSFQVRHYPPRMVRNPKTGERLMIGDRFKPAFQPGKTLRELVNNVNQPES